MSAQDLKVKYEEFADRMEQTRMELNGDHSWRTVKQKTDEILEYIREKGDSVEFSIIFLVLAIPLGIIALIYMYSTSFWPGLLGILTMFIFMVYYRIEMRHIILKNSEYRNMNAGQKLSEEEQILAKIKYINSGIEVKKKRVILTRYFYILTFPILLILGTTLIQHDLRGIYLIWSIVFAFLLSGLFWSYYFQPDLEDLEITQEELEDQESMIKP